MKRKTGCTDYFPLPLSYDAKGAKIYTTVPGHGYTMVADMRGWGYLTGKGALGLDPETAGKIQDEMGRYVTSCANFMPEAVELLHELCEGLRFLSCAEEDESKRELMMLRIKAFLNNLKCAREEQMPAAENNNISQR